jgi:Protein of unknown function (DUF935).
MSVDGKVVQFATRGGTGSPDLPELGAPGQQFFHGFLANDEYVPDLMGIKGLAMFDKMRRSDGMIQATLRAIKLPLLAAKCDIVPASEDAVDIEIAKRLEWNLFEGMTNSWNDHLRQTLTYLEFGFHVTEIVWAIQDMPAPAEIIEYTRAQEAEVLEFEARDERDLVSGVIRRVFGWTGRTSRVRPPFDRRVLFPRTFYMGTGRFAATPMVAIRKLAPRLQRTINAWDLGEDGGLRGVEQWAFRKDGSYKPVPIPVEKLLVFVNDKEGASWTGKSVLRPAYKHWFIKDQLYRIDAIAAERHGVGIPVMAMPEDKSDNANLQRAEDILIGVRAHERGYVVEPFGYKFRVEGMGQGRAMDLLPIIQHHDRMIAVSVLAPQLALGENPQGSFAMSKEQSGFFMLAERAVAAQIADVHNRYLIPKWVNFNYSGVTRYPTLSFGAIETREVDNLINALVPAVNAGLVTADDRLEGWIRETAGLPERDPSTARITRGLNGGGSAPTGEQTGPPAPTPPAPRRPGNTSENPPAGGENA